MKYNNDFVRLMSDKKITKKKLGDLLGYSQPTIKNIFEKPYSLKIEDILLISQQWNIDMGELFASSISYLLTKPYEAYIKIKNHELRNQR